MPCARLPTRTAAIWMALIICLLPGLCWGQMVYGYEDPLGMLHLSRTKKNSKYKPLYKGSLPTTPEARRKAAALAVARSNNASSAGQIDGEVQKAMPSHAELIKRLQEQAAIVAPAGPLTGIKNLPPPPPRHKASIPFTRQRSRAWAASRPYPHPRASKAMRQLITRYATENKLDPLLVYCVIEQESAFAVQAVSPKGAQGLMQLMPGTQQLLGVRAPFNMEVNIKGGTRYLRSLMLMFNSTSLALAAYNAGPGAVARYNGVPPYAETQDYVARIMARYAYVKSKPATS